MRTLTNITSDIHQQHTIVLENYEVVLVLRFYGTISMWCMDVTYRSIEAKGIRLSLGVLHLSSYNFPFDFVVQDKSLIGIDPCSIDDFATGRILIHMLTPEELIEIRGYEVEI